jgi:MFS family permease
MLRRFSRDLRLFLITAAVVSLTWDGIRAVLFNLYLLRLGYGPEFIGVINGVGAFAFALLCPLAGAMGTRWASRRMLQVGIVLLSLGFLLTPVAELMAGAWSTGWLLATSVLSHMGLASYLVNGLPFMMGATEPMERNHAFSVHSAVVPLSGFVGSLVAGALPGALARLPDVAPGAVAAYRFPLWLAALLLVPGMWAVLSTRSGAGPLMETASGGVSETQSSRAPYPYGLVAAIALIMALRFGGRGTTSTFFNVYLDEGLGVSTALIGVLLATSQLLSAMAALAAPLLMERWGTSRAIVWGTAGVALWMIPLALIPHWAWAGLGFAGAMAMFAATMGPIRVFSQEMVVPHWRATMASAYMMGAGLAYAGLSLAGGYVIVALGYRSLFLGAAGLMAAGAIVFWGCFRVPRGELASRSPLGRID